MTIFQFLISCDVINLPSVNSGLEWKILILLKQPTDQPYKWNWCYFYCTSILWILICDANWLCINYSKTIFQILFKMCHSQRRRKQVWKIYNKNPLKPSCIYQLQFSYNSVNLSSAKFFVKTWSFTLHLTYATKRNPNFISIFS